MYVQQVEVSYLRPFDKILRSRRPGTVSPTAVEARTVLTTNPGGIRTGTDRCIREQGTSTIQFFCRSVNSSGGALLLENPFPTGNGISRPIKIRPPAFRPIRWLRMNPAFSLPFCLKFLETTRTHPSTTSSVSQRASPPIYCECRQRSTRIFDQSRLSGPPINCYRPIGKLV